MAAAAYRSGSRLKDERTGTIHRYEKRKGVKDAFILAPHGVPEKFLTRAFLWNAAEQAETRKNARVAREVILALPHELSDKGRAELARDMALYLMERYRVAVDVAIHSPVLGDGHDGRNHHAHLLFTTREVTEDGFGKKTRILDDKQQGPAEIELIREVWETLANDALERAGFPDAKIDRRTLEAQGVERIPQTHIGPKSKATNEKPDKESADDEDEDGEGEEGKQGGSSSSGGAGDMATAPKVASQPKEEAGRIVDYPAIDKGQSRTDFIAYIKAINERRAALPSVPLAIQIAELEILIEGLEARIEDLKPALKETGVAAKIKVAIGSLFAQVKAIFLERKADRQADIQAKTYRQAREERQLRIYGRTYRRSIHEQIREMTGLMDRLERRQAQYQRLQSFYHSIEHQLGEREVPVPAMPKAKLLSEATFSISLAGKAIEARKFVPEEYRPKEDFSLKRTKEPDKSLPSSLPVASGNSLSASITGKFKGLINVTEAPAVLPSQYREQAKRDNWFIAANIRFKDAAFILDRPRPAEFARLTLTDAFNTGVPQKRFTIEALQLKMKEEGAKRRATVPERFRPPETKSHIKRAFNVLSAHHPPSITVKLSEDHSPKSEF